MGCMVWGTVWDAWYGVHVRAESIHIQNKWFSKQWTGLNYRTNSRLKSEWPEARHVPVVRLGF